MMTDQDDAEALDLFVTAAAQRDAALALADRTTLKDRTAVETLRRLLNALLTRLQLAGRMTFTADLIGELLDDMGVAGDLATRRRLVSTFITRGKHGGLWTQDGFERSTRRHCAPIGRWRLVVMADRNRFSALFPEVRS
jgi:hypothetical protein